MDGDHRPQGEQGEAFDGEECEEEQPGPGGEPGVSGRPNSGILSQIVPMDGAGSGGEQVGDECGRRLTGCRPAAGSDDTDLAVDDMHRDGGQG